MTPEQAERMASTQNNSRELRMLRAQEQIAQSLAGIHQTLGMWFYKMYEEDCAEQIQELLAEPNAEVRLKEKREE